MAKPKLDIIKNIARGVRETTVGIKKISIFGKIKKRFVAWRKGPENQMLINMELRNGDHVSFTAPTRNRGFEFLGGIYLYDDNLKYYHQSSKMYALDYHQDFNLPVQRRIYINEVKKTLEQSGVSEVELATNPSTLQSFIDSRIVSEILQSGVQIEEFFKSMKTLLMATLFIVIFHLVVFIAQSGVLDKLLKKGG